MGFNPRNSHSSRMLMEQVPFASRAATLLLPQLALRSVLAPDGTPYASGDDLFKDAFFGRDSEEACEHTLDIYPELSYRTLLGQFDPQFRRVMKCREK